MVPNNDAPLHALSVVLAASEVGAVWLLPLAYCRAATLVPKRLLTVDADPMEPYYQFLAGKANTHSCTLLLEHFAFVKDGVDPDPLRRWDDSSFDALSERGMCNYCREDCKRGFTPGTRAARAVWGDVRSIFCLPAWDELNATKRAAMGEEEEDAAP
ncbi:hypothetical protein FB451DRAFT_1395554 [Mycena latifolia]|nr:hypothetical protein FB451DRAFT_1395554 [Mycena latifolia]